VPRGAQRDGPLSAQDQTQVNNAKLLAQTNADDHLQFGAAQPPQHASTHAAAHSPTIARVINYTPIDLM